MKTILVALALGLSGCAYSVHQVHVSDFKPGVPLERGEVVKAKSEQFVIMGFARESNYVDSAYQDLQTKCPNGTITGITTQFSTDLGFFSWTNRILMQGLCIRN